MAKKKKSTIIEEENIESEVKTDNSDTASEADGKPDLLHTHVIDEEVIKRRIRKKYRRRTAVIAMLIFITCAIILLSAAYGVISFIEYNSLKITVDKSGIGTALSLSENYDVTTGTSVLDASGPQYMDNVSYKTDINSKMDKIISTEGSSNGANYIAYTFYLQNLSSEDVSYREVVEILSSSLGMQDAMRILVVKKIINTRDDMFNGYDGDWKCYATTYGAGSLEAVVPCNKYRTGGALETYGFRGTTAKEWKNNVHYNYYYEDNLNNPEQYPSSHGAVVDEKTNQWMTTPFDVADKYVINSVYYPLQAGSKIKYSIVIWLEGWDPECVNKILGGMVSLNICFTTSNQEAFEAGKN